MPGPGTKNDSESYVEAIPHVRGGKTVSVTVASKVDVCKETA